MKAIKTNRAGASKAGKPAADRLPRGTKMRRGIRNWTAAALCCALALSMAACSNAEPSSEVSSQVSSAPSSAVESSQPESSQFVPPDDLIPTESVKPEAEDFETVFSQNPIDQQYDKDYGQAASFSMMRQACNTAAKSWENMIDVAYRAAMDAVSEEERAKLQEEQDLWADELDGKIEEIRAAAGDDNEGVLDSARQIVLLYRERAKELCKLKYDVDGELPAFETAPDDDGTAKG